VGLGIVISGSWTLAFQISLAGLLLLRELNAADFT
jgi:hypothetical protein